MKKNFVLYQESRRFKRKVCLDEDSADTILDFLEKKGNKKKFDYIVGRVLEQDCRFYEDYIQIKNYENLTEFRLFPQGANSRIYCKEVVTEKGELYIIAIEPLPKKRDADKALKSRWDAISKHEYDVD